MAEPTGRLTFRDLLIEVAEQNGTAFYGDDGSGAADVPRDAHALDVAKRRVNSGIRMFINDSPPEGWNWTRPTASVPTWGTKAVGAATLTVKATTLEPKTTLGVAADTFFSTMEEKTLTITSVGNFVIDQVLDARTIVVRGNASTAGGKTFSITSNGNYTLPKTFGGAYAGRITLAANSDVSVAPRWADESEVRRFRELASVAVGSPEIAAVRLVPGLRRRWELMLYPSSDRDLVFEFPFELYFDALVDETETHPAPFVFDEAIKAACLAASEREDRNTAATIHQEYYLTRALPQAWELSRRMGPKNLGPMIDPSSTPIGVRDIRATLQRPNVTFMQS